MELVRGNIIRYGDQHDHIGVVTDFNESVVEGIPLDGAHFIASIESCSEPSEADVERWNAYHNDGAIS